MLTHSQYIPFWPSLMDKKDKQKAAARARARRRTNNEQAIAVKSPIQPASKSDGSQVAIEQFEPKVIFIDNESNKDYGYTGGVNHTSYLDAENDAWFDDSNSEFEQIGKMEGEELDKSLQALKAAIELYEGQKTESTIWDKLRKGLSGKDWAKVESN